MATAEPHQRHPPHKPPSNENSPLIYRRHLSLEEVYESARHVTNKRGRLPLVGALTILIALLSSVAFFWRHQRSGVITIEHAREYYLPVDDGITLWFRTWGNVHGVPVLFVHGGPGNAIADYYNGNKDFFSYEEFFVVEVDQRGTGKSQPSVRDDWKNMALYKDISIDVICADFERVREHLGINKWLVWGGSFGSTLSINYGTRYPQSCLTLILRGIYLDTVPEVNAVYSRSTYLKNPKRLAEFDILYDFAAKDVQKRNEEPLDPDDAYRLMKVYERMITSGDRYAIWHWHVFENNLMEVDPQYILDPNKINPEFYPEAQSIAFFETRLWLRGSFEDPSNLMDRIDQLDMPMWVCQGNKDEVCPVKYAHMFVSALEDMGDKDVTARFVDAGHEQTDPVIAKCLKESLQEYLDLREKESSKGKGRRLSTLA